MPKYAVLDKVTIISQIMPHLPLAKRGFVSKYDLVEIVNAILYKLKTGLQWEFLPVGELFSGEEKPSYRTVFHHYRKWCVAGVWQGMFSTIVSRHKEILDLSLSHIDGSHTPVARGGEAVEYQGRKKRKTTNALYLTDNRGIPLAMAEPQEGNHDDVFEIGQRMDEIVCQLNASGIEADGLFSNADAGFDARSFRVALARHGINANVCPNPRRGEPTEDYLFDPEMYRERWKIERTNAWMGGCRSVRTRFDITVSSWKGWNFLAFIVIFLKKLHKSEKFR